MAGQCGTIVFDKAKQFANPAPATKIVQAYQGTSLPVGRFPVSQRVATPCDTLPKDSKPLRPDPIPPCDTHATRGGAEVRTRFLPVTALVLPCCLRPARPDPASRRHGLVVMLSR